MAGESDSDDDLEAGAGGEGGQIEKGAAGDDTIEADLAAAIRELEGDGESARQDEDDDRDDETGSDTGAETLTDTDDDDGRAPPQSWTAAEREAWAEIPDAAQEAILRRERDFQNGIRSYRELDKVLDPVRKGLDGTGVHLDQYVERLIAADQYIDREPLAAALQIIETHGLRDKVAERLAGGGAARANGGNGSGNGGSASNDRIDDSRIQRLEAELAYQRELDAARAEWAEFQAAQPEAGRFKELIAGLIGQNPRLSYSDAFDKARAMAEKARGGDGGAEAEAARLEAAARRAGKGRRLELPRGSTAKRRAQASTGNLDDDIAASMDELGYR